MPLHKKDFFGLRGMSADDIRYILGTAETMKYILNQKDKKTPHLQGKSVIMLFYEQSARAKLAYELAAQYLSANVIDMTNTVHSIEKESLQDIGQLMDQMGADFIILRHSMAGAPRLLASCVEASVINAGDGFNENPGQSLLDLLTIREQKGGFEGLKVAIIGDLLMLPAIENFGVEVYYDAREAVNNADVILTTRMRMEKQDKKSLPSLDEYKRLFRIDENLLRYAKKDAIVMHPGPIQRGIEISSGVIDSKQCIINDQIGNSVAVRMAMFYILSQVGGAFR